MSVDSLWIWTFACVFVRCGAMLLASPLFGGLVPVNIRVLISVVIALAITPVVQPFFTQVPVDLSSLALCIFREAAIGILIGFCLQLLMLAFQMAGAFLDLQIGFGSAQIFNPSMHAPTTILGQFKFLLGLVILLLVDGHHLMLQAFVASYQMGSNIGMASLAQWTTEIPKFINELGMLSLQIAAPVAAVCIVIDAAIAIVNKSVPQMQAFMVAMPAKIAMGLIALSIGLPMFVVAVQNGVQHSFETIQSLLGGR